ncbi:MAG: hypothetical protein ABSE63_13340 [Thermoguttaceae bacterium]|jgi:hypothetical protein
MAIDRGWTRAPEIRRKANTNAAQTNIPVNAMIDACPHSAAGKFQRRESIARGFFIDDLQVDIYPSFLGN